MRKIFGIISILLLSCLASAAEIRHRFLVIDNNSGQAQDNRLVLVDQREPSHGWSVTIPGPARDMQLLGEDRVLVAGPRQQGEYALADGRLLRSYSTANAICSRRQLADGSWFLARQLAQGVEGRWESASGDLIRTVSAPGIMDVRLVRPLPDQGMLCTAVDPRRTVEIDARGSVTWVADLPGKGYQAERQADGTTWVSTGDDRAVVVIDHAGRVVRRLGGSVAHPQGRLLWFSGFHIMRDGGVVVANWCGHGHLGQGPHAVQFNKENQLIWSWEDHHLVRTVTNLLVLEAP